LFWVQQAARRGRPSQVRPRLFPRLRGQVRPRIASLAEVEERARGSVAQVRLRASPRNGEQRDLSFADSDSWHDTQWQDCRADSKEQMGTILIPYTRAWARAFVFGETTDVLQYAPSGPSDQQLDSCLAKRPAGAARVRQDLPKTSPPPSPPPPPRMPLWRVRRDLPKTGLSKPYPPPGTGRVVSGNSPFPWVS